MKIRKLASVAVLGVATALMVCANAQAQPGGGRGGRDGGGRGFGGRGFGFGGPLALLQRDDVQEELQLTSAQQEQLEAIEDDLRPEDGGDRQRFGDFREMSDAEREEAFARMREQRERREKLVQDAQAKVKDILNADQTKRLSQLELQFALQRLQNDEQLSALTAYLDQDKFQAAIGEPFEFETRGFGGGGRGGRGDRGGPGAERGDRDGGTADEDAGGRRRRRGA